MALVYSSDIIIDPSVEAVVDVTVQSVKFSDLLLIAVVVCKQLLLNNILPFWNYIFFWFH